MRAGVTTIGFTGARETNARQAAFIRAPVAKLEADALVAKLEADAYVSGACTGVDEVVARAVAEM
jgi:16S rRNA G527 N7-methylase RsmG